MTPRRSRWPDLTPGERAMQKIDKDGPGGCWVWTGTVAESRIGTVKYGHLRIGRSNATAHRVVYEHLVGPIPPGLVLDHLCRNTLCVNPEHLEPVTNAENVRRGAAVKTHCKQGHEFTPENTYQRKTETGHNRMCRTCRRERMRVRR